MKIEGQPLLIPAHSTSDSDAPLPLFSPAPPLSYFNCVNLQDVGPLPPEGKHIYGTGRADDQLDYHLKGQLADSRAAINEFLLTHLAKVAKLPTVPFKVVRYLGSYLFGSETVTGLRPNTEISRLLQRRPDVPGLSLSLTRILAFDFLMGNPDRHYKNFLIQGDANSDRRIVRVIDFSTAALMSSYWQRCQPLPVDSETVKQMKKLKGSIGTDKDAGRDTLTIIGALPSDYWTRMTDQVPPIWYDSEYFSVFEDWWRDGRHQSLELADQELARHG